MRKCKGGKSEAADSLMPHLVHLRPGHLQSLPLPMPLASSRKLLLHIVEPETKPSTKDASKGGYAFSTWHRDSLTMFGCLFLQLTEYSKCPHTLAHVNFTE